MNIKIGQGVRELGCREGKKTNIKMFIIFLEQKSLSCTKKSHNTLVGDQKVLQLVLDTQ